MSVVTTMDFLADSKQYLGEKPYRLKFEPPAGLPRTNIQVDQQQQLIEDIRGREKDFTLENNGFTLVPFHVEMAIEDYDEEQKIKALYLPKVAELLKDMLRASRVQIFEHLVRKRHISFPIATGELYSHYQPTTAVHIDMTKDWARKMAGRLNHKIDTHQLPSQNFQFYNVWKPLRGPVKDWPLALCDSSSLDLETIEAGDVVFQDFSIENALVKQSSKHKWYYISNQMESEAWIFEQGDAKVGSRLGVPHTSFHHPNSTENDIARESIEVRALVFFEDQ